MTIYQSIVESATSDWQLCPEPNPKRLGYYIASGQVQFSTHIGWEGSNRLQQKLNAINATHNVTHSRKE